METIKIVTSENTNEEINLEVHFNLWNSEKNNIVCLDIGIMAPIKNNPYSIDVIIPGKYNTKDKDKNIIDLGKILIEKEKVTSNVFNCKLHFESENVDGLYKIINKENTPSFILHQFIKSNKNIEIKEDVLKLSFDIKNEVGYKNAKSVYYRVRINNFCLDFFSVMSTLKSKVFNSQYDITRIIDFRINDVKLLNLSEAHELSSKKIFFEKVHFFYITDIDVNLLNSNKSVSSRLFEKFNWNDYIDIKKAEMMAYHLSIKTTEKSPSFLLKLQKSKTSFRHIIIYSLSIITFAIFANWISHFLF